MRKHAIVSKVLGQDYLVSRTASSVRIEVLDYHAEPLTITREELREFGLVMVEAKDRGRVRPFENGDRSVFRER